MKLTVSLLLSGVLGALCSPLQSARPFHGYSNSLVHEIYPDQTAQSAVNYNPNQLYNHLFHQEYPQQYQPQQSQQYQPQPPQSQLFNVGYSVTFTNNPGRQPKHPAPEHPAPKYSKRPRNDLEDGEIITGTRKQNEEVRGPSAEMSPQEFVAASLIAAKRQKISGIKPKPQVIAGYPSPKLLLSQANLSPATQKFYKAIEQAKPQVQNTQELQQKYSWRNLGPGVEIIRSTEVPVGQKYTRPEPALFFDHAKALGRSQEFDYTNVVDGQQFYGQLKKPFPAQGVDTTLLREPVQVDMKLVEEAARAQAFGGGKYSPDQESSGYLQQAYRTIPVHENTQSGPPQAAFQREQNFLEYQPNRFQYKIYGKPQPLVNVFGEPKAEHVQRQPRFLSSINTNLRPPPVAVTYQRRIHAG